MLIYRKTGGGKILWIDIGKLIGVTFVVFGHLYSTSSSQRIYIYAFHMPLFFFLSGYLHKQRTLKVELLNVAFKLLLPSCIFILLFIIVGAFMYNHSLWESSLSGQSYFNIVKQMLVQMSYAILHSDDVPNLICWFLFTLGWCRLFHSAIDGNKWMLWVFIITFPFIILQIRLGYINNAYMAYPFYFLGNKSKKLLNNIIIKPRLVRIISAIFLMFASLIISHYNGRVSMSGVSWGNYGLQSLPLFYINGITGTLLVVLFASIIESYCYKRHIELFSESFLSILGFQYFFIYTYIEMFGYNAPIYITLIATCIILLLCCAIHYVFYKRISKYLNIWQQYMMQKYLDSPR